MNQPIALDSNQIIVSMRFTRFKTGIVPSEDEREKRFTQLWWLLKIRINGKKKREKKRKKKNCSEEPHPAISADLKFPICKLARRRMKVNEVSCQQRLECCSQTSGHSESLRCIQFGNSSFQRPGPPAGSDLSKPSNWLTHRCQLRDKMLN